MTRLRAWVVPTVLLGSVGFAVFWGSYLLDLASAERSGALAHYLRFDPASITDATASLAGTVAAVFGIVVTVVAIVVQLAAERFPGVVRRFLADTTNQVTLGGYITACVGGVWGSVAIKPDFAPTTGIVVMLVVTTLALASMAPYLGYVFRFLEPSSLIRRIRRQAVSGARRAIPRLDRAAVEAIQSDTIDALEELADITTHSLANRERLVAGAAVGAVRDFVLDYLAIKGDLHDAWFILGDAALRNPHVVALDPASRARFERRRTWVEWKALRQLLAAHDQALQGSPELAYVVAIDTRYIAVEAARRGDTEVLNLTMRFLNSYVRSTLNAGDVRAAYNLFNQYRLTLEALVAQGRGEAVVEAVGYMTYYGHLAWDMKLPFVVETVAHDMSALCQQAAAARTDYADKLLDSLLELDRPLRLESMEGSLLGVRKAQAKLATWFLSVGDQARADRIANDMASEPSERLETAYDQLARATVQEFWEVTDRGQNFDYLPREQRDWLGRFFEPLLADIAE